MHLNKKDFLFLVIIFLLAISLFIFFPKKTDKVSEVFGDIIKLRIALMSPNSKLEAYNLIIETINDVGDLFER